MPPLVPPFLSSPNNKLTTQSDITDPTDWSPGGDALGDGDKVQKGKKEKAIQGSTAAGARALSMQLVAFYFRAPAKAFMRVKVDYMQVARAVNPHFLGDALATKGWSLRFSTIGLLAHAVKHHGWGFVYKQVLPPMFANATLGAILYTSYLQTLAVMHQPASTQQKRIFPPAPFSATFTAGFIAGGIQSVFAAPLEAISTRFNASEMLSGSHPTISRYAYNKFRQIGPHGVYAGYPLAFVKETLGFGLFFGVFEFVQSQCYYHFLSYYYGRKGRLNQHMPGPVLPPNAGDVFGEVPDGTGVPAGGLVPGRRWYNDDGNQNIGRDRYGKGGEDGRIGIELKPHYLLEPTFLLLGGLSAAVTSQIVQYPIDRLQRVHYTRLESIDWLHTDPADLAKSETGTARPRQNLFQRYHHSYIETFRQCKLQAKKRGLGWKRWFYKGFLGNTVRTVPSTAAGLVVFEVVRRYYGEDGPDGEKIRRKVRVGDVDVYLV
ncbi:mitochondrial carrier [Ascobolus immersus RN42]|uniref:Mitochondrial carrier n=1 Tax=Ascobolus immersus RN42 TaxID=1160509 RepID=A0A3N4HP98_ASCIM|nr:mitochondrial carrier [Ascobolus immersus RN42]